MSMIAESVKVEPEQKDSSVLQSKPGTEPVKTDVRMQGVNTTAGNSQDKVRESLSLQGLGVGQAASCT